MPATEREAFAELWQRSERFRGLSAAAQQRLVQRAMGESYGGAEQPSPPELLGGVNAGRGLASGLVDALSAVPRNIQGFAREGARMAGNLPRAVARTLRPAHLGPVYGDETGLPPRAEELIPSLAPQEGEEVGRAAGTMAPFAAGGFLGATTKAPAATTALIDYLLTLGDTDSEGEAALSAGLGALPEGLKAGFQRGAGALERGARSRVRGMLPTTSTRGAHAVEGSIDEVLEEGVPRTREGMAEFFAERRAGAESQIDEASRSLEGRIADTTPIHEALEPHRARAFVESTETSDDVLQRLIAEDPKFAQVIASLNRSPDEVIDLARSSSLFPEEKLAARQSSTPRPELKREAATVSRIDDELELLSQEVAGELGAEGAETLARSPRLADLMRRWHSSPADLGPDDFVAAIRNDAADAAAESLRQAGSPDDVMEIIDDMRRYHEVEQIATKRIFGSASREGIGPAVGASAFAFGGPAALLKVKAAMAILHSPQWASYGASGMHALGKALASPNTDAILDIASRVGAATPALAGQGEVQ